MSARGKIGLLVTSLLLWHGQGCSSPAEVRGPHDESLSDGGSGGDEMPRFRWEPLADMRVARQNGAAVAMGTKLYVMGGHDKGKMIAAVERFDAEASTWDDVVPMPAALCCFAAQAAGGKIYVTGGTADAASETASTSMFVYDPARDSWSQGPEMPRARKNHMAFTWQGKIGLAGGSSGPEVFPASIDWFDPASGSWQQSSSIALPTARGSGLAVVRNDELFVIGGYDAASLYGLALVDRFSFRDERWTTGPNLSIPRGQIGGGLMGDWILAAGGWGPMGSSSDVEGLGPGATSWTTLPSLHAPRSGPAAAALGDTLVVAGGAEFRGGRLGWVALASAERLRRVMLLPR